MEEGECSYWDESFTSLFFPCLSHIRPIFLLLLCHMFSHVLQAGHIGRFIIVAEEAVSKGIRRIVALTGQQADLVRDMA